MMLAAPCTRCQGPVEPPHARPQNRPRELGSCRRCRERESNRARMARYRQTEMYRAMMERYRMTETYREYQVRYKQSDIYREGRARYRETTAGRAADRRYRESAQGRMRWASHAQTAKGRATRARYRQSAQGRAAVCAGQARRRARKRAATIVERVDRRQIFDLDGGLCHLCDLPVDQDFHIDHIIPLVVEPIEAAFNCAVAHPTCNVRKQARVVLLSPSVRARWQMRRPAHLAQLETHFARIFETSAA